MKFTRMGAFLSKQNITKEIHTCLKERTIRPSRISGLFGYTSGGSFPKSVRCLPVAFILVASFLINACGNDFVSAVNSSRTNISTLALSYENDVSYDNKTVNTLSPKRNDIPKESEAVYSVNSDPETDKITIDNTNGTITIAKGIATGDYKLTVMAIADSAKYSGINRSPEFSIIVNSSVTKTDIKVYALVYTVNGSFNNKTENTLSTAQNDIPNEANASYSLTSVPANSDITINSTDGTIKIARGTLTGLYKLTVSASASADNTKYTGNKTSQEFTVTVNSPETKTDIKLYDLVYTVSGTFDNKTENSLSPSQNGIPSEANASYSLTSVPANSDITINSTDGTIKIAKDTTADDYKLTVTAVPNHAKYTGSKLTPEFSIAVRTLKDIKDDSFAYGAGTPQVKTGGELAITTDTIPPDANVTYSLKTPQTGITVDGATGSITVDGTVRDGTHDITVTATVPGTNLKYTGSKSVQVLFEVLSAAGYKPDATQAASSGFFTVGDIDSPALVTLIDVTDDTTVSDQKIEIKGQGSNTSLYKGAATTPKKQNGKVTLGIPPMPNAYDNFKGIANDATIDIVVSAKVNGKNIAKTFSKPKALITDIYSWRDLDKVRYGRTASYTLKNDIAFPAENTYGYTDTFTPIGDDAQRFTGVFDGKNKTISGLKITGAEDYRGLFGYVYGTAAEIKDLMIDHRGISGKQFVGAVAGKLDSGAKITRVRMKSTNNARISGSNDDVGGLVGFVKFESSVFGYATGEVIGSNNVGGLVGTNSGTVIGYATGAVNGTDHAGGLVGRALTHANLLSNNNTVTGYARGSVTRKTGSTGTHFGLLVGSEDLKTIVKGGYSAGNDIESNFANIPENVADGNNGSKIYMESDTSQDVFNMFDFSNDTWQWVENGNWPAIRIGTLQEAKDQPIAKKGTVRRPALCSQATNKPSVTDGVYQVTSELELKWIVNCLNGKYELKNDITLSTEWTPLGSKNEPFLGVFNGGGNTISELNIDKPNMSYIGLFGHVGDGSTSGVEIKNLILDHKGIVGKESVGALAGIINKVTVDNVEMKSTSAKDVSGDKYVGGLAGYVENNSTLSGKVTGAVRGSIGIGGLAGFVINNNTVTGNVTGAVNGNAIVGGLAGYLVNKNTLTGYSTGTVSITNGGSSTVGGLVGLSSKDNTVTGYATGKVNGNDSVGGLVGSANFTKVTGFSTGEVSGNENVGGLAGHADAKSTLTGYATGAVNGKNNVGGLAGIIDYGGKLFGYARNTITRTTGSTATHFGLLAGNADVSDLKGYHSSSESKFVNINPADATGKNANDISMDNSITRFNFDKATNIPSGHFDFSNNGEWSWVKDGNWPAIKLPALVGGDYSTDAQPTTP